MRRMSRIFRKDGKTVIVAMDHGLGLDVTGAMKNTGPIIEKIVAGGADAILTTFGIAQRFEKELMGTSLILRVDGGSSAMSNSSESRADLLHSVESAVKMGADAVVCMGFLGTDQEATCYKNIAYLGETCRDWGIPLIAEMLPGAFGSTPEKSVKNVRVAARIGADLGATIIKTSYVGTPEEFADIVDNCFVPIVILGGANTSEVSGLYTSVEEAMGVGTAGVAFGRNVWGKEDPEIYTRGLVDVVHNQVPAGEVIKKLS